jgi:hypothetical protein
MNERIRQLAEQAGLWASEQLPFTNPEWQELKEKKFAELIVGQMLEITDAHTEVFQTDRDKALVEHIKQSVKQHFGVEE